VDEKLKCPKCDGELTRPYRHPFSSFFAGAVYCASCEFSEGLIPFLGKSLFPVEPIPEPYLGFGEESDE